MSINSFGSIVNSIYDFFYSSLKDFNFDIIFAIGVGLMAVFIAVGIVRAVCCYESKAIRGLNKANRYLLQNPAINEDNLITFHNYIKKMPQRIRDRWQLYVLERDGLPSRYLTTEYCVRRPLSNSVLTSVQKQVKLWATILSSLTFILGLGFALANINSNVSISNFIDVFIYSLVTPAIIILMAGIFNLCLQFNINNINSKVYTVFNTFVRNVNRAVATMPDSIDYEVLFTQKEIDEGIPILREYLEKKALEEQQLLEASKYNAINHSPYNFDDLGIDGQQLITRAVNESENFLLKKIGLENEIQEFEKKLNQSEDNMDEIEKEANRKLQTIKENLERLDKAIAETTNRVEINYNRRQIKDEMEKRAAIEKDLKSLLAKEQVNINECKAEIQKRREMIDKDKGEVEVALKSEYNTFAVKVYDTLSDKVNEENTDAIKDYQSQIVELKAKVQSLSREIENKDSQIAEKDLKINTLQEGIAIPVVNQANETVQQADAALPAAPEENLMTTENAQQNEAYYDENGNAIDYSNYYDENGNLIDYSQYYDENGNLIDYSKYYDENGNYIGPTQEQWNNGEINPKNSENAMSVNNEESVVQQAETAESTNYSDNTQENAESQNLTAETANGGLGGETNETEEEPIKADLETKTVNQEELADATLSSENAISAETLPAENKTTEASGGAEENTENADENFVFTSEDEQESLVKKEEDKTNNQLNKPLSEAVENEENTSDKNEEKTSQNKDEKSTDNSKAKKVKTKSTKKNVEKSKEEPKTKKPKTKTDNKSEAKEESAKTKATEKKTPAKKPAKKKTGKIIKVTKEDDFSELQKQIEEENQKIQKEQDELRVQIDNALNKIENTSSQTSRKENIKKIKELIDKLKEQAKSAKARGAKNEIKRINASVAELVEAITRYSTMK